VEWEAIKVFIVEFNVSKLEDRNLKMLAEKSLKDLEDSIL
jgi:hypothetical protein